MAFIWSYACNVNVAILNCYAIFQPFASICMVKASHDGVVACSPDFLAHINMQNILSQPLLSVDTTPDPCKAVAMEVIQTEKNGGGPIKESAHLLTASNQPWKQKQGRRKNLFVQEAVMMLREKIARNSHIATHGTKQECF